MNCTPIVARMTTAMSSPQFRVFVFEGGSRCFAPDQKIITDRGSIPISAVNVGDRVKSIGADGCAEFRPVLRVFTHATDKPMIEVKLTNGKVIRCSADHKFLYQGEYIPIIDILKQNFSQQRPFLQNTGQFEIRPEDIASWQYIDGVPEVYDVEVEANHNYLIDAGREICVHNSSKTYSLIQFLILYALQNRKTPTRIVIARKKATWLSATVWNDFLNILLVHNLYRAARINKTLKTIRLCSTTFEFIGLDDTQRLHGLTTDIFWINEAMEASKDDFDQLEQRTSRFGILDYNPSAEEHWIYDNVCLRKDCYFDHSTMLDNPFIPENSRRKILSYEPTPENYAQGTADDRKWKIYGLGCRAKIEGLIFPEYTIVEQIPVWVTKRWYGLDFGFSNDPTACAEIGFYNNALYIDEQFYRTEMLSKDIIHEGKKLKRREIISESADPRLIRELQLAGLLIYPVEKYAGSIAAGIDFMKGVTIYVTSRSVNTIKELNNYTYKQTADGKWLNEPEDDNNHVMDLTRYVCLERLMGKPRRKGAGGITPGVFR